MTTELTTTSSAIEPAIPPTLIAVILDESGSMGGSWDEVIAGFNRFLQDQWALPDSCRLSLTKFNTVCSLLYPPRPLAQVPRLDRDHYTPGGNTALFDAIAETVRVAQAHKLAEERVLCVVITDGAENASRETTQQQVTEIIKALERRGDWTFVYLGVTPDQFIHDMKLYGTVVATNTAAYNPGSPRQSWDTLSQQTTAFRARPDKSASDFYRPVDRRGRALRRDPQPDAPVAS